MIWIESNNPNNQIMMVPVWATTVGVSEDGQIFVTAAIAGSEQEACLRAACDGTPVAMNDGHAYVPLAWLAAKYPHARKLCAEMEAWTKKHIEAGVLDQALDER